MSIFKIAIGIVIGFIMLFFVIGAFTDWTEGDKFGAKFYLICLALVGLLTYLFLG